MRAVRSCFSKAGPRLNLLSSGSAIIVVAMVTYGWVVHGAHAHERAKVRICIGGRGALSCEGLFAIAYRIGHMVCSNVYFSIASYQVTNTLTSYGV